MDRVLDAAKRCCERWGFDKVTIDDIAADAGVSRATIYRMFPGGKDVLFEALRVRELEEFFTVLRDRVEGADSLEDLLVRTVVVATAGAAGRRAPGPDAGHRARQDARRAHRRGRAAHHPLRHHVPRSARRAVPRPPTRPAPIIDVLARLTISYFLAPSDIVDLGDEASARAFLDAAHPFQPH